MKSTSKKKLISRLVVAYIGLGRTFWRIACVSHLAHDVTFDAESRVNPLRNSEVELLIICTTHY